MMPLKDIQSGRNALSRQANRQACRRQLPVHFFTIVLNGEPFIRYHLDVFDALPFKWHWHIIEGVADLVQDTAWSRALGGRISPQFHVDGRSKDGTGAYLDEIKKKYPGRVSVYRKPLGRFWNGKLEMVNAPLAALDSPCLLWQVDVDEFWTPAAIVEMHRLFHQYPQKTAAYFHCHYFLGPLKYVVSMNTWATRPTDWLRVWRFAPGMRWASHEPPRLVDRQQRDVGRINPFTRDFTLQRNIVFQHYAYVFESQVRFKESYYGYRAAVRMWKRLNRTKGRVKPAQYLPWADDDAWADDWRPEAGRLLLPELLARLRRDSGDGKISVQRGSAFEQTIVRLINKIRPRRIIETGTYLGRGTTTIVWKALAAAGIEADFTTIEVNPEYHRRAKAYFSENGMKIKAVLGLSLARRQLPSVEEIQRQFVEHKEVKDIYYDHPENLRSVKYFAETDFDVPDRRLEKAMQDCNYRPDLVLLDSAGHLGYQEFDFVRRHLQGACHLVLDDVHHCKHYRSLQAIKADPRFELLEENDEKFGFAVARFQPVKCLVFLRTDSIGDSLLAAPMIEHIYHHFSRPRIIVVCQQASAPLYRQNPCVDKVMEIPNEHQWENPRQYGEFLRRLKQEKPDMLLNTTYSVHEISDLPGLDFIARRIAFRNCPHATYTCLLDPGPEKMPELKRHARFLEQIGICPAPRIAPKLKVAGADMAWAEKLIAKHAINPRKLIVLFASSRVPIKQYNCWGKVFEPVCRHDGFRIVALGVEKDRGFADTQLGPIEEKGLNLCGRTTIFQAAALIKKAALAAGCDTFLAHVACAVGTSNVVVAGGGHLGRFLPYSVLTSVVCRPLDCFGCGWKCKFSKPHCLEDVPPWLVRKAIEDSLQGQTGKAPRIYFQDTGDGYTAGMPAPVDCKAVLPDGLEAEIVKVKHQPQAKSFCGPKVKPRAARAPIADADQLPLISVVTPCLNQGQYLEQCIESILGQGYPNLEYIVMDGGSSDGSVRIIKKYSHLLAHWQSKPDAGQYAAIAEGFSRCRGQVMTWLNADDIMYPGTLFAVAAIFLCRPDVQWITGIPNSLSPDGRCVHVLSSLPLWSQQRYFEKRFFTPFIQQEGTFWRRSLWEAAGGCLRTELKMAGDLELWTRFFRHSKLHSVDLTLALFRQHAGQKTAGDMGLYFREAEQVLEREIALWGHKRPDASAPAPITFDQVSQYLARCNLTRPSRSIPVPAIQAGSVGAATGENSRRRENVKRPAVRVAGGAKDACQDDGGILVSALVSTYNAENFIQGCLEDLLCQTMADQLEIIVIDSGSHQDEAGIVKRYRQRHANIRYLRTEQRETVYQAWNRALKLARGKYVTSANTDDRHRRDAFEQMVTVLEDKQNLALVYADVVVTDRPCSGFDDCRPTGFLRWHDWDRRLLLSRGCFIGPQPMWRRKVHEFFGLFDTSFKVAADYELWLRISQVFDFYHLSRPLGVYLKRPDSIEHANADLKKQEELKIVTKYLKARSRGVLLGCRPLDGLKGEGKISAAEIEANLARLGRMAELAERATPSLTVLEKLAARKIMSGARWQAAVKKIESELLKGGKQMDAEKQLLEGIEAMTGAGKIEAARWALEKMIQDYPGSAVAHYNLAVLAFDAKDTEQARDSFQTAASLAPDNFAIQKQLADFYYVGANDPQKALEQYEVALRLKPDHLETLTTMAHLNVSLKRFSQALEYYHKVLEKDPANVEISQIVAKLEEKQKAEATAAGPEPGRFPEQAYQQASDEAAAGNLERAEAILKRLVADFPDFAPAYNDLGVVSYELKRPDDARRYYQQAVALQPDSATFHKNLADFYLIEDKQVKEAMEHYLRAMTLDPTDSETLMATGNVCLLLNQPEDARTFFERVLELEPWHEEARRLLEQCGRQPQEAQSRQPGQGNPEGGPQTEAMGQRFNASIASLEQKLVSHPNDATAHNDLGVLYYEAGRKELALEHYRKAVELDPLQATFKKNLADFYFIELKQPEKAMEIYVELLKNDPRDVEALFSLGQMCRMMGKYDDARQFLARALELEPGNQELLAAINQLESQVAAISGSEAGRRPGVRLAAS